MAKSVHESVDDPRNRDILIFVNGAMKTRDDAVVSVFDSGFVLGDGVWEGLRVSNGHPAFLEQHLDRLYEGAKAIALDIGMDRDALTRAIYATLAANGMRDGVHVRLMVTRGVKRTPYQDPRVTIGPATIVIIPEHKNPLPDTLERGLALFTVHVRRGYPDVQDPKLNSHSKLNCITACIQAYTAGADEALMLDPHGFVATCNSTHFFIVRKGEVWTSTGMYCLGGITRGNVLAICRDDGVPCVREIVQPDRRVRRRRSVRDRHIRRRRAGAHDRWTHDRRRPARTDGRATAGTLSRSDRERRRGPRRAGSHCVTRTAAYRDVVGTAQHLDRDDARVGKPRRLRGIATSRSTRTISRTRVRTIPGRDEVVAHGETDWRKRGASLLGAAFPMTGRSGTRST